MSLVTEEKVEEVSMSKESSRAFEFLDALDKANKNQRDYLIGRVLTVIDSMPLEERQNKAVKDLIHSAFSDFDRKQKYLTGEIFSQVNFLLTGIPAERLEGLEDKVYLPSLDLNSNQSDN